MRAAWVSGRTLLVSLIVIHDWHNGGRSVLVRVNGHGRSILGLILPGKYINFDEIEDILRMRCDQTFDELIAYVVGYLRQDPNETHTATLKPTLRFFYLHSEIVELLMLAKRIDIIQDSFRARPQPFKELVVARHGIAEEYVDYAIAIRIGFLTSIWIQWIENG